MRSNSNRLYTLSAMKKLYLRLEGNYLNNLFQLNPDIMGRKQVNNPYHIRL